MYKMHRIEILAPAGGPEALLAAVHCGADAVYLGAKALNARRNAQNFDEAVFAETLRTCHARGVKVYLTLNTLLFHSELPLLQDTIRLACETGVDGVITQDLGVAEVLRRCAPQLPLHASTQMSIHNLEGARELQRMGYRRVVLARELTRSEIARIVRRSGLECEIFVHGALCMCVSGQCYLSSMIGERSGNRGLCAQPCRLPFSGAGEEGYALSLKDLSLADRIGELEELGVHSLKIEGRMKRPEYVAAAVTACREAREGRQPDFDTLRSVFSRSGFTNGYYTNRIDGDMFGTRQKEDVVSAAGVLSSLSRLAAQEQPRVPVDFSLTLHDGQPACLSAADHEGHCSLSKGPAPQQAHSKPTTPELAEASLRKLGGTFYTFGNFSCEIDDMLMLPVSQLNALRREALEELSAQRASVPPLSFREQRFELPKAVRRTGRPALRARLQRAEQLSQALLEGTQLLSLPPNELLQLESYDERMAVEIPRILFDTSRVREQLRELAARGIRHAVVSNPGAFSLAQEAGMELHGGFGLNVTNSLALQVLQRAGLCDATLSFELSLARLRDIGSELPTGILAYGSLPLMIFRNCPVRSTRGCRHCTPQHHAVLTDRRGARFPLLCQGECAELLNSVPLYLADRLGEFSCVDFATLYFTYEDAAQCAAVLRAYQQEKPAPSGVTRGLYYRNVL